MNRTAADGAALVLVVVAVAYGLTGAPLHWYDLLFVALGSASASLLIRIGERRRARTEHAAEVTRRLRDQ